MEHPRLGYLPEAMVNFLALLGWSPGGDREVLTRDELTELFALEGISGGNAVFNTEKLDWFNQQHIGRLPGAELLRRIEPRLRDQGLWRDTLAAAESAWIVRVLDLLKPRVKKLDQLVEELRPFLVDEPEIDPTAASTHLRAETRPLVEQLAQTLEDLQPFDPVTLERAVRATAGGRRKGGGADPRDHVAVTGRAVAPGCSRCWLYWAPSARSASQAGGKLHTCGPVATLSRPDLEKNSSTSSANSLPIFQSSFGGSPPN
jgi:glutamyl-tRNA synthetase